MLFISKHIYMTFDRTKVKSSDVTLTAYNRLGNKQIKYL